MEEIRRILSESCYDTVCLELDWGFRFADITWAPLRGVRRSTYMSKDQVIEKIMQFLSSQTDPIESWRFEVMLRPFGCRTTVENLYNEYIQQAKSSSALM